MTDQDTVRALPWDWYPGTIPENVVLGDSVYIETSFSFRGGPGRQLYQAGLSPANPDGPFLYELVCSACHRPLATSQVRGKSASEIQHKIDENEGGMGALSVLTAEEVAAIAAALEGGGDD